MGTAVIVLLVFNSYYYYVQSNGSATDIQVLNSEQAREQFRSLILLAWCVGQDGVTPQEIFDGKPLPMVSMR